jgi:hypothetical protein
MMIEDESGQVIPRAVSFEIDLFSFLLYFLSVYLPACASIATPRIPPTDPGLAQDQRPPVGPSVAVSLPPTGFSFAWPKR